MAFELTEQEHLDLDKLLGTLLKWHKDGEITLSEGRSVLAHLICAAGIETSGEVRRWLKPEVWARWKGTTGDAARQEARAS